MPPFSHMQIIFLMPMNENAKDHVSNTAIRIVHHY